MVVVVGGSGGGGLRKQRHNRSLHAECLSEAEGIDGHDSGTESDGDLEQEDDLIQEHEMELSK
ncbi:hypothetical protein ZHAS_00015855 [Anopheles sinensis]|uniref:Uncharacterized protein n=1 Tax=Anopheles sinensis TaxID=74873 RepID=A0A084WC38_ANOSI|nr:hypothetical protein ZHAS_00015855 [Anopheles sinensis]